MTLDNSSGISGLRQACRENMSVWLREVFFLFYGVFFLCSFADKIMPGHALIHYMFRFAFAVHAPAVIFVLGCSMGLADPSDPSFRKNTLMKALYSYLAFFIIGFVIEVFVTDHDAYTTIKDILIVVRVPDISSVFLTMCFLLLISAFFWDYIEYILSHRIVLLLVSLAGILLVFLPEGLLGYGLIGTVLGGATTNCTPIAYYLFLYLAGILYARSPSERLLNRKYLVSMGLLTLAGGLLALARMKHPAVVILSIVFAFCCMLFTVVLFPLYSRLESALLRLWGRIRAAGKDLEAKSQESRGIDRLLYYAGYSLLFVVMAYFIFFPYIQQDRTLIWYIDGIGQYVPKAIRFMRCMPEILSSILHGNLDYQQYDFTTGLGSTFTVSHEPVYWLYLFFKPSQVETAYSFQVILRYFLAGISISAMLRYFKRSRFTCYLASMAYTFCGYAIFTGTRHGMFQIPMILLPLLIVSMEELVTRKRWVLLTLLTAVSLLSSYYFMYMNTIALGIYFLARILCTEEYRNLKTFFSRGLMITGCYIIGCAMGSVTLFNSFGGYVGSSRSAGESVSSFISTTPFFYRPLWISDFFIGFISDYYSPGLWLRIGLAPIALLSLVFIFTRKRKKEISPVFILLTVFCIIPVFGYALNGFSNVSNRWCYIYITAVIFILAEYLEDFHSLTTVETGIMCSIGLFYGLIIFFTLKHRTDTGLGSFGLLSITLLALILVNNDKLGISRRRAQKIILGVTLFSIVMNANMYITNSSGKNPHIESYVKKGGSMRMLSATALKYLDEVTGDLRKDDFYRSTNLYTYGNTRSSSLVYGYHDISTFNSTLNGNIVNYNRQMGNSDCNVVSIYSYNFRTIMEELASVRYLGADSSKKIPVPYGYHKVFERQEKSRTWSIYENDYALPIGYTYSSIVSDKTAEKLSAAQKQELSLISAIVDDETVKEHAGLRVNEHPALTVHDLPVTGTDMKNVKMGKGRITVGEGGGSVTLHFDSENNAETYISFKGDIDFPEDGAEHFMTCKVLAEGVDYNHQFRVDAYSTGQEEYLFNLGYHKDPIRSATLQFGEAGTLHYDQISVISQSMDNYGRQASLLGENALEDVRVEKNTVKGSIHTDEERLLVISLPYQSGWTAYVDGKKTPILRANYQYMGIDLPAGSHEILLKYRLPGQKATFICTTGGILVFLLCLLCDVIIRKRRKQKNLYF